MGGERRMKSEDLIREGYTLENMQITSADLSMEDHGVITLSMGMKSNGISTVYGGICLGHGYLEAKEFSGSVKAMPYIMRIMDVVGVDRFNNMKGKYVRVASRTLAPL